MPPFNPDLANRAAQRKLARQQEVGDRRAGAAGSRAEGGHRTDGRRGGPSRALCALLVGVALTRAGRAGKRLGPGWAPRGA